MKNLVKIISVSAIMLTAALSCSKEQSTPATQDANKVTLTFVADAPTSKTVLNGDTQNSVSWNTAENSEWANFIQSVDGVINGGASITGAAAVVTDGKATFQPSFTAVEGGSNFTYYSYYPGAAYVDAPTSTLVALKTPATQTPSASSFDPNADLLVSKPITLTGQTAEPQSLRFARLVTLGKITITGLPEDATTVSSIKITAHGKALTGQTTVNMEDASTPNGYGDVAANDYVELNLANCPDFTNNSTAIFTCYPVEFEATDEIIVTIIAGGKYYEKSFTPATGGLKFQSGVPASFTVNFTGIEETKGVFTLDRNGWNDNLRMHVWKELGNTDENLTTWPGMPLNSVTINGQSYKFYPYPSDFTAETQIGVIFNSNGAYQTSDIYLSADKSHYFKLYAYGAKELNNPNYKTYGLYVKEIANWNNIYVYGWFDGGEIFGTWHGTAIHNKRTIGDTEYYYQEIDIYDVDAEKEVGIKFNYDGWNGTNDLTLGKITADVYVELNGQTVKRL